MGSERSVSTTTTSIEQYEMFINGERRPAAAGAAQAVLNPATGEQIAEVPRGSAADADAAVAAAEAAFPGWAATPPAERSLALIKLAERLEAAQEDVAV